MGWWRARTHRRQPAGGQAGAVLTELIVGVAVGVSVLFAIVVFVEQSLTQNNVTTRRIEALHGATQSFELMQRDLRSALEISPLPPASGTITTSAVVVRVWVPTSTGVAEHGIKYNCAADGATSATHSCQRIDEGPWGPPPVDSTPQPIIDAITGDPSTVFTIHALSHNAGIPASSSPYNPRSRVTTVSGADYYRVSGGSNEDMVAYNPSATYSDYNTITVGTGTSARTVAVYRFVSWRDEECPII